MSRQIPHSIGSAVMLAGAFAVGWVLHQVIVQDAMSPTAPASVVGVIGGLVFIAIGRAMERRFDPSALVPDPEEREDEGAFDEALSPLDESDLEGYERDEPRQ